MAVSLVPIGYHTNSKAPNVCVKTLWHPRGQLPTLASSVTHFSLIPGARSSSPFSKLNNLASLKRATSAATTTKDFCTCDVGEVRRDVTLMPSDFIRSSSVGPKNRALHRLVSCCAAEERRAEDHTPSTPHLPREPPPSAGTMCTLQQRGRVFVLTLTGDGEHRLGHALISSLRSAVASAAEGAAKAGPGCALVTVGEGRFFSNGLDIGWAGTSRARLGQLVDALRPLAADLLALPMPTVAAVTGHASAGGCLLALCHDYRVMRGDRGVLYMSEVDIGLPLPPYFMAVLRAKITSANALRDVALRGKKVRAAEGKEMGIVDAVYPTAEETAAEAFKFAEQLAARKWDGGVYASIRMSMYPEACKSVGIVEESDEEKRKYFASKL